MDDIYRNIGEHNSNEKTDDMVVDIDGIVVDMLSNKKPNPVIEELFITGRKLNISFVFLGNLIFLYQKILN